MIIASGSKKTEPGVWRKGGIAMALMASVMFALPGSARANPAKNWADGGTVEKTGQSHGIDKAALRSVQAEIFREYPLTRSLLVVRNGALVSEKYFGKARQNEASHVASVTKSVIATLAGIAVDQGKIAGLDVTLAEMFPKEIINVADPRTRQITLRQLLTMTTGLKWFDRGDAFWSWTHSYNRYLNTIQLDQLHEPGTVYNYSSAVSNLIGGVISRSVGQDLISYANEYLFGPMGEEIKFWRRGPMGNNSGGKGLRLTPRQMAKLGLLYLRGGKWGDKQLVSKAWLDQATKMQVRIGDNDGYGYQFWIKEYAGCAGYLALGRGGQHIVMIPEKDLAVVVTANFRLESRTANRYRPHVEQIVAATSGSCKPDSLRTGGADVATAGAPDGFFKTKPVDPPRDVAAFFEDFMKATVAHDLEAVMALYSDRYYLDGMDKSVRRKNWARILTKITKFDFTAETVKAADGGIHYTGQVKSNIGLLNAKNFLVKENGRWVLLGNPKGRPDPVNVPDDLTAFVRSFATTLERDSSGMLASYFSDRYHSNGFNKAQVVAFLKPILGRFGKTRVDISEYIPGNPVSQIDGIIDFTRAGRVPMKYLFAHIIREDGNWVWYGNQLSQE